MFSQFVLFFFKRVNYKSNAIVDYLTIVFFPGPRVLFLVDDSGPDEASHPARGLASADALNIESYLNLTFNYLSSNFTSRFFLIGVTTEATAGFSFSF